VAAKTKNLIIVPVFLMLETMLECKLKVINRFTMFTFILFLPEVVG
jgi:hypothetical protein